MLKQINIYDVLLFLLLMLMAAGGIGRGLQPTRLLAIACSPICLYAFIQNRQALRTYTYEAIVLAVWFIWALLSLRVARDLVTSSKDIVYLMVHTLLFWEIIIFASAAKQPIRSIVSGWVAMMALTIPVAIFELIVDIHLPMSVQESGSMMNFGYTTMQRKFASVTFGNLNSYNQVICLALPFIFYGILQAHKTIEKIVLYTVLLLLAYIIIRNSSRGALLCLGAGGMAFLAIYFRRGEHRIAILVGVLALIIVGSTLLVDSFDFIVERLTSQGGHDTGRMENIIVGMQALADSYFFGIGIGNYNTVMGQEYGIAIPAPHNLLLEVLVLYGVVIFIGYCLMYVHAFNLSLKGSKNAKLLMLFIFVCLGTSFFIDSTYLNKVTTWAYMACMLTGATK